MPNRLALLAVTLLLLCAIVTPCPAADLVTPIGGLHSPEDIDTLGDGRLLIVQMQGMSGAFESNFALLELANSAVHVLPVSPVSSPPRWGDGSCSAPDPKSGFHGFDRWTGADGRVRIVVVNHGTRSSVERFRLDRDGARESLAWEGCVSVPAGIELNDVTALGEAGFVVTVMGESRHFGSPEGFEFLLSGQDTGHLASWSAERGWETLAGTHAAFPNGIVASPDGRTLWFAAWTGRQVLKYDRGAAAIVGRVALAFLPDNLSWTPQGTILVAGIPDAAGLRACVKSGAASCDDAWVVSEIDPESMTARTLASGPTGQLGGASVAVRVGDALYVGAYSGDRILRIN